MMEKKNIFYLQLFGDGPVIPVALREKAWAQQTWTMALKDTTISNYVGKDTGSIVQLDDTLKKEAGDQITFHLRAPLTGEGTTGDDVLEGNEEAMEYYDFSVTIDQIRHATRLKGKMAEKKTSIKLRTEAKDALKDWFAEKIETMYFDALSADPSSHRIVLPNGVNSVSAITNANTMSCAVISKAKRKAKKRTTYTGTDGKVHILPKIRSIKVNGKDTFILIITEEQARDLRNDPVWIAAQSQANVRSEDNPLFSGAEGIWDGVIIFTNDNTQVTPNGASGIAVGHALFLGAQAACFAVGSDPEWNEDEFDFGNKVAFETGQIFGIAKSVYDGEDFGVLHVYTASVEDE